MESKKNKPNIVINAAGRVGGILENNNFKILEIFKEDLPSLSKKYISDKFGVSI